MAADGDDSDRRNFRRRERVGSRQDQWEQQRREQEESEPEFARGLDQSPKGGGGSTRKGECIEEEFSGRWEQRDDRGLRGGTLENATESSKWRDHHTRRDRSHGLRSLGGVERSEREYSRGSEWREEWRRERSPRSRRGGSRERERVEHRPTRGSSRGLDRRGENSRGYRERGEGKDDSAREGSGRGDHERRERSPVLRGAIVKRSDSDSGQGKNVDELSDGAESGEANAVENVQDIVTNGVHRKPTADDYEEGEGCHKLGVKNGDSGEESEEDDGSDFGRARETEAKRQKKRSRKERKHRRSSGSESASGHDSEVSESEDEIQKEKARKQRKRRRRKEKDRDLEREKRTGRKHRRETVNESSESQSASSHDSEVPESEDEAQKEIARKQRKRRRLKEKEKEKERRKKRKHRRETVDESSASESASSHNSEVSEREDEVQKDLYKRNRRRPKESGFMLSESEDEDQKEKARRRRKRKRRKEKEMALEREMKRKVKRKRRELKEKKLRAEMKKKRKQIRSKQPITSSWGKYGILKDIDMWNKRPEFGAWLTEVKKVNSETLKNWEEKEMFKEYMEDYNTATFPSKKYYNLDAYHHQQMTKERMKGMAKVAKLERIDFNDEDERRVELQKEREEHKEAEMQMLMRKMQGGMAEDMRNQAQLREEMQYQFRLGNTEAAQAIQRRLDPDAEKFTK